MVEKFWSVRTVRVVYHLPKISGLSRRARQDSSYNMKLVRTGHFHDDDVWLQLPEFISSLFSYLNLSIPLRFIDNRLNLHKKIANWRILVVVVKWRHRAIVPICKWQTNFHSERPNRENGTSFSEFPFVPGIFQWDETKKRLPFTSQLEFPEICGKW